jgi:hypothetical protein
VPLRTAKKKPEPSGSTRSIQDLVVVKEGPTITCFRCDKEKPVEGSLPFHAHRVCYSCRVELSKLKETDPKKD